MPIRCRRIHVGTTRPAVIWAEDQVGEDAEDAPGQYVILGAGLDSFAYRQSRGELRIFEVDHPASQGWKRARLARLGITEPESVSYVAVDFEAESFDEKLKASGFDPARPSVVAWLGVSYYLTPAAIDATLDTVARWARVPDSCSTTRFRAPVRHVRSTIRRKPSTKSPAPVPSRR